jgi:NADH-quinone oxidoreductase subunit J
MPAWLFVFFGALAIVSALGVIVQRNPVHCLLSLVLTLLVIAVLFIAEGAVVVGFLQAIIYAGAIMVIFLFVVWLLNIEAAPAPSGQLALKLSGAIASAALVAMLFAFFASPEPQVRAGEMVPGYGSIAGLARVLFADYLIAFEVTSILLLAALVGAVAVARPSKEVDQKLDATQARADEAQARREEAQAG